jgi:hypothetical protein
MKKVLFVLAVAGVMVSCGNKKKSDKPADGKDTTSTSSTTTTTTITTTTTSDVPTFADPEVQKFVNDYTAFVNSYMDAYKGKDMAKVAELSANYQQWAGQIGTIGMKLAANPDEAKKFSAYMTKLSMDWANAAKAMMPSK